MHGFWEPEPRHGRRDQRDGCGRPNRGGVAEPREDPTQSGPENETEAECSTNQSVCARAILGLGDVGDIGACRRDIAARQAVDDPGQEQHRDAVGHRKHHEANDCTQQAEDQDRAAAVPIRPVAEHRRGQQLADREHREQQADDERRRAKRLGIERQQRDDDPEADQVDEDGQKDDEEWTRHGVSLSRPRPFVVSQQRVIEVRGRVPVS